MFCVLTHNSSDSTLTGNKHVKTETNKQTMEGRLANLTEAEPGVHHHYYHTRTKGRSWTNQSPLLLTTYLPKILYFLLGFLRTLCQLFWVLQTPFQHNCLDYKGLISQVWPQQACCTNYKIRHCVIKKLLIHFIHDRLKQHPCNSGFEHLSFLFSKSK